MAVEQGARLREEAERWLLPLVGGEVDQLCVDFAFTVVVDGTHRVRMSCPITYRNGDAAQSIAPDDVTRITPLLGLHQAVITEAWASKDGALHISFNDHRSIVVEPSEDYEAWEVSGGLPPVTPDYQVVALPGGGVATF